MGHVGPSMHANAYWHKTGHSKRILPRSSTTRTKLDPLKSLPVLNSLARTLAWRFADPSVGRLRPSSSGKSFEPPTM